MTGNEEKRTERPPPQPDRGLYVPPMSSLRVSGKPLDEGMREKYTEFIDQLITRIEKNETLPNHSFVFAFRVGKGFIVTPRFMKREELDALSAIEVVDHDPSTGRTLTLGTQETPNEAPLIWWGFRLYGRTNFGLLFLGGIDDGKGELKKGEIKNVDELPNGIWHENSDGRRMPGIKELVDTRFPPEAVMKIIADCSDDKNSETPLCREDRSEIEFADGRLVLSRNMEGLFD